MTGLHDTDIRLNDEWALTQAADGDAPLCSGLECLYQNIILEALTQPGDLFYDASFGWGLYDFIQSEDDDLVRLEIAQRARLGLQKREVIVPESIEIDVGFSDDTFRLRCSFQFADEEEPRELSKEDVLKLNRIHTRYTRKQIEEFIEEHMTGEQMRLADMKVEDDEDFEKIILAYDYSTKHGSRYQVIEEGGLVESGKYRYPKLTFVRRRV